MFSVITMWVASLTSTQGSGIGLSLATEESVRGEFGKDGWVTCGVKDPLYWSFSSGVVSSSVSSVGLISSGWVKSSVGWVISSRLSSATSFICWSSSMLLLSCSVLANLVGKFSGDSTYSELPSLSPELATNIASLSGLKICLGVAV